MTNPGQISHVLLDLDGTLVDSLPGIEYATARALDSLGITPPPFHLRSLIGPPIRDILATVSGIQSPARLTELELAFRAAYDSDGWLKTLLFPDVRETLASLVSSGLSCFVITNKPRVSTERILSHLRLSEYLTAVLSPDHRVPAYKTKAEAASEILTLHRLRGGNMLFVGDSLDDAQAAHACGCQFAAISYGYGTACSQSAYPVHCVVARFSQLRDLLFPAAHDKQSTATGSLSL
jgi:phosphoglycolate phosphatase